MPITPRAYRPADLAERWSVSLRHVYHLLNSGQLGHILVGTLKRIRQQDVDDYEARQTRPATQEPPQGPAEPPPLYIPPSGPSRPDAYRMGQIIAAREARKRQGGS